MGVIDVALDDRHDLGGGLEVLYGRGLGPQVAAERAISDDRHRAFVA